MKKKVLIFVIALFGLIVITIGTAFAFFTFTKNGSTENIIRTGNIAFHYDEISGKGRGINLIDALPADSDEEEKLNNNYFDFKITAESDMAQIPYTVTAKLSEDTTLDLDVIKVYLTEIVNGEETPILYTTLDQLPEVTFKENELELYKDTVPVNGSSYERKFRLRMWVAENTNFISGAYSNKKLSLTVNVYTNQGSKLTEEHLTKLDDTSIKMISINGTYLLRKSNYTGVDYEVNVPNEVNTISFDIIEKNILATSTVTELGTTLSYNNEGVIKRLSKSSSYSILTGDNYFKLRTTAADGQTTKDYILKVNRELSRNNNLTSLSVEGYAFDEPFDENTTEYHVTMEGNSITLSGNKGNDGSSISGLDTKNLTWGENRFEIVVTPEDSTAASKTYTIIVNNVRPEAPVIAVDGETPENSETTWVASSQTIVLEESGTAISGVAGYEYYKTQVNETPTDQTSATGIITTSPYSLTINDQGTTYIYYRTVSENGNKSVWSKRKVVNIDSAVPTNIIIAAADGKGTTNWHGKNTKLNISATKNGASDLTYYYGETSVPTTVGNSITLSTVTDETGKTYYAKICNQAGLCSDISSYNAKVADYLKDLILADNASTKDTIIPASELKYKGYDESSTQYRSGLFKAPDTDGGYTYYFRGKKWDSSWPLIVIEGDVWVPVRINGNGTIRLLTFGIIPGTVNSPIKSFYGKISDTTGYSYNNVNGKNFTNASTNISNIYYSNATGEGGAKTRLDTWYNTYIKNNDNYKNIITSGTFCQAAKVRFNSNFTTGVSDKPLAENYVPSYDCPMNDGNVTNAKLTLEVGLLSLDEFLMSGGKIINDSNSNGLFLGSVGYNVPASYTMTPGGKGCFSSSSCTTYNVFELANISGNSLAPFVPTSTGKLDAVINIKSDTLAVRKEIPTAESGSFSFRNWFGYQVVQ